MTIDLSTALEWGPPKQVVTKQGPRILRVAPPTDAFREVWRVAKDRLKSAGISWRQNDRTGEWSVCWWQQPPVNAEMIDASRAVSADIDVPRPAGLEYLPYQRGGIAFALEALKSGRGVLIGDEMGLGKTIQGIGIINATPNIHKVLVICPASLKLNWAREIDKWLVRRLSIGIATSQVFPSTDICIMNFDIAEKWAARTDTYWDLVLIDEAHYLKNPKARRTVAILGGKTAEKKAVKPKGDKPARQPKPAVSSHGIQSRRFVCMTGTPILNKPIELWPIIHRLDPKTWANWFQFAKRYCGAKSISIGQGRSTWDVGGATNLAELQTILRGTIMVRRMKADVLKELPPKRRQVIEIPADGEAGDLVRMESEQSAGWVDRMAALKAAVELAKVSDNADQYAQAVEQLKEGMGASFEQNAKIAQEIALAKVPYIVEHVVEMIGQQKVIVFAHHLAVVAKLKAAFANSVTVTGPQDGADRQRAVDRFQRDPACRVIIGTFGAMAEGHTLTAASTVVCAELHWVPGKMSQAEDRAHRIGQANSVLVQHFVLEGSLDAKIAQAIVRKQAIADQALDRQTEIAQPEAQETVVPVDMVSVTKRQVEAQAQRMTPAQITAVHDGLRQLAAACDGARAIDGHGFAKFDALIGKSLAQCRTLTARQAVLGKKLVNKYRRQLGPDLVAAALGEENK